MVLNNERVVPATTRLDSRLVDCPTTASPFQAIPLGLPARFLLVLVVTVLVLIGTSRASHFALRRQQC